MSEYAITGQADAWRGAQNLADQNRAKLIDAVRAAHAAGVSEYRIADAAGVTRGTVRAWLGKGK